MVHGDASFYDAEVLAYQAKMFVEELIKFLVFGEERFTSRQEFGEYLSLPNVRSKLTETKTQLKDKLRLIEAKTKRRSRDS